MIVSSAAQTPAGGIAGIVKEKGECPVRTVKDRELPVANAKETGKARWWNRSEK